MMQNDTQWRQFNTDLLLHAQRMNWSNYRMTRYDMAEFLRNEGKLQNALETYLEVCYLDLNGAENRERIKDDPEMLKQFPAFDPKLSFLAPAVIRRIKSIIKKLKLEISSIRDLFSTHNTKIQQNLNLPVSVDSCWKILEKEIKN